MSNISLFRFKYIVVLDIDEVIVPKKHASWPAMMEEVLKESAKEPNTISWHFRHTYFIDGMTGEKAESNLEQDGSESSTNIPDHLHMLNHVFRSATYSKGKQGRMGTLVRSIM